MIYANVKIVLAVASLLCESRDSGRTVFICAPDAVESALASLHKLNRILHLRRLLLRHELLRLRDGFNTFVLNIPTGCGSRYNN